MSGMPNKLFSRLASGLALTGAALLLIVFASPSYRQGEPSVAGKQPADFTFQMDGKPTKLSDLRGKVVVLNFWATWCPPCVEEMPSLNRLHDKISVQGGMVLGVSVDEDVEAYTRFLAEHHIRFPNHREPTRQLAEAYGSTMYPETYIIGRDGRIARKIIGPRDWDGEEMLSYLETLLKN